ncbi:MAG: hypothetical protein RLZZ84_1037 [Pseudomonadota bacterium]|jgi:tetratricopeptide (TPR) repeat protein
MNHELHSQADHALAQGNPFKAIALLKQASAEDDQDFAAWMKLATLQRAASPGLALDAVNAALQARPNDFLALLLKGSLHEHRYESGRAAEVYQAALFHAADVGQLPPPVAQQLDHARQFLRHYRADVAARMPALAGLDAEHAARAQRLIDNVVGRRTVYHQQPTHYRYPGLPDIEYFDFAYATLKQRLREAYSSIRQEFEALHAIHAERQTPYVVFAPGQPMGQWAALNRSPDWNAFHLIRYGEPDPVNAAACPQTVAAFAGPDQPDVAGITPNLMFSLLAPQTRIPAHHGVANFRVLVHLPIIVPGQCHFRVGADMRPWVEGEPWIFDDTIEHEAWNDSDQLRIILIGDLWRPELDAADRAIVRDLIGALDAGPEIGAL